MTRTRWMLSTTALLALALSSWAGAGSGENRTPWTAGERRARGEARSTRPPAELPEALRRSAPAPSSRLRTGLRFLGAGRLICSAAR